MTMSDFGECATPEAVKQPLKNEEHNMTSVDTRELTMHAWKMFSTRDPEQIAALFTNDAEWIAPEGNATAVALNFTNHMVGAKQIAQFIAVEFHKMFRDATMQFRTIRAAGDMTIVEERMQATLSDGRIYDNDYCFIFEFEGGLIRQVREYMDTRRGWNMVFGENAAA
jgi:ketosteroid isomerase-like protein